VANSFRCSTAVTFLVLLGLGLSMFGCGSSEPSATDDGDEKPRIALVMKSLANEFFLTMANGAKEHQAAHADQYTLISNGIKNETDLSQQMRLVEQMIAEGVDAIVIAPADSKALVTVCRRAAEKGIIVVNIDNKFDADVLAQSKLSIPFVGPDNREGARVVGEYLAGHLKPGDPVAILEGIPTAFNAQQRRAGFEQAMQDARMEVVDVQSGQWEMAKANTVAAAMIIANPELKAILCSNDSMALGAVAAVKAAGKTGQIAIVGFDNISAIQQMLVEDRVLATADQHGDQLAAYGIEFALQLLAKEETPKDKQTPVDLITAEETTDEAAP